MTAASARKQVFVLGKHKKHHFTLTSTTAVVIITMFIRKIILANIFILRNKPLANPWGWVVAVGALGQDSVFKSQNIQFYLLTNKLDRAG